MSDSSSFNAAEKAIQARLGIADIVEEQTRGFIRPTMPIQHQEFFAQLPWVMIAAIDSQGQPWLTPIVGQPGFIQTPSDTQFTISQHPSMAEALQLQLSPGNKIGVLGIELPTRRRNRMNGRIVASKHTGLSIQVEQSYGNCPKYIQQRQINHEISGETTIADQRVNRSQHIDTRAQAILESADTFFIASRSHTLDTDPRQGIDASHRGGKPGFIKVDNAKQITFPDFSGNRFFNTLGNIQDDGRVGLFVLDFSNGDALFISGKARILWDEGAIKHFAGAERLIEVSASEVIHVRHFLRLNSQLIEPSPFLAGTGTWKKTLAGTGTWKKTHATKHITKGHNDHRSYSPWVVDKKVAESGSISSFYLRPTDKTQAIGHYTPGQFLPIRIEVNGQPCDRNYTLSQAPNEQGYRITVKREDQGLVSRQLHDQYDVGSRILVNTPAGNFQLQRTGHAIILLSSGVGITPMIAILEELIQAHQQTSITEAVYFIHTTRNSIHHAFKKELENWSAQYDWLHYHLTYTQATPKDQYIKNHHHSTRLTSDAVIGLLDQNKRYDVYLCGSESFMRAQFNG